MRWWVKSLLKQAASRQRPRQSHSAHPRAQIKGNLPALYKHGWGINKRYMTSWISNYIHFKAWDEITYPFPNFNGCTIEVWEWISNFIPYFTGHMITYPWWEWQVTLDFNNYAKKLSNHTLCETTHNGFCVKIGQTTVRLDGKQKWLCACTTGFHQSCMSFSVTNSQITFQITDLNMFNIIEIQNQIDQWSYRPVNCICTKK